MKRFLLFFFIMIGNLVISQSKYSFDYALLYDISLKKSDTKLQSIYFINSTNNNYFLNTIKNKDSIHVNLYFLDFKGLSVSSKVAKADFYRAETFTNECSSVRRFANSHAYKAKEYAFEKHNDTLINDTLYFHYAIKSVKSLKHQKRKKIHSLHFIIDKNSEEFKPFLHTPLVYSLQNLKGILPDGLTKMMYYKNYKGEITETLKLVGILKTDKYLTIPDECDFIKIPK